MTLHRLVDTVTLFALAGIGIALAWVLVTRTDAADATTSASPSPVAVVQLPRSSLTADDVERIAAAAAKQAMERERARERASRPTRKELCDAGKVDYGTCMEWGYKPTSSVRDPMCSNEHTTYEQRQILGCDGAAQ